MNENPITIIIENYKGKKLTFTASNEAAVHLWKTKSVSGKKADSHCDVLFHSMNTGRPSGKGPPPFYKMKGI